MVKIGRIGKDFILEVEEEIYRAIDIQEMDRYQVHMLVSFCETKGQLMFVQKNTDDEQMQVYIDNILFKL